MRGPLSRITAPISACLPDISHVPPRRQISGAIVASVIFHLLLLCVIVLLSKLFPDALASLTEPKPAVPEIELQIVPPPAPAPIPPPVAAAATPIPVIDPKGLEKSEAPPKQTTFQSSQDMQAGSQRAGKGSEALPSQDGVDLPFNEFKNQRATLGKGTDPTPDIPAPPLPPMYKPKPLSKQYLEALAKIEEGKATPDQMPPTPSPAEKTPEPAEPAEPIAERPTAVTKLQPDPDSIPLFAKPTPPPPPPVAKTEPEPIRPKPVPNRKPQPPAATPPPQEMAMLTTPPPRPQPVKDPGYQPDMRQTRIEGNISNRNSRPGVDAVKTPLGVYRQQVSAQIQSRWLYYTKQRMDLLAIGTVRVRFFVDQNGRVKDVQIVENDSNQSFASICEQSVREAEIAPPPADLELMKDGRLELVFSFTLY